MLITAIKKGNLAINTAHTEKNSAPLNNQQGRKHRRQQIGYSFI
ncbi:MAG: hypothetical protein Q7J77_09660 [Undibacterium sp.]|nr:hypothetical protein [Undibacterium sp.]